MKFQELLVPITLALLIMVGINYFFPRKAGLGDVADRQFVAPTSLQVAEPLDLDIDFEDKQPPFEKQVTLVKAPHYTMHFSNYGGVIEAMEFKRYLAGNLSELEVLAPTKSHERGAFLVALQGIGKTPLYYELVDKKDEEGRTVLTYKGSSAAATITKVFTVYHESYVVDLELTIDPKEEVRPRIFFPAPQLASEADFTKAVLTSGNYLEMKPLKEIMHSGVEHPTIFGLEDTYFANVLFKDSQGFAQRAYFKQEDKMGQAVLQSTAITEKTTWLVSFYTGPKELKELAKVDPRLEGLLSYGWFAPVSKLLLQLLNWLYSFLGNYGLAIIVLTILVRLLLVPFTLNQEQQRKKQTEASKKLKYIEQRYKDNPEELNRQKAEFARKHGLPGLAGCLPMLLQIPVFIGLQRVLVNAIELYKAPFLWIPDLSAPDPWYILPALVGLGLALSMSQMGDAKQLLVNLVIAVVATAFIASFSAGLTLFISVSTLLGLAQTAVQRAFA